MDGNGVKLSHVFMNNPHTLYLPLQGTVIILVLFSAMLTAKQYFGDPIDCFVKGVPGEVCI